MLNVTCGTSSSTVTSERKKKLREKKSSTCILDFTALHSMQLLLLLQLHSVHRIEFKEKENYVEKPAVL